MIRDVDPKVYELAGEFVDDILRELRRVAPSSARDAERKRLALVGRAARAMQQAIEDECEAIRLELFL